LISLPFKKNYLKILIFLLWIFWYGEIFGGFGITPPFFRNENLTRGSHFEEKVYLVRGNPVEDAKVTISVNVPGADSWIKIDKGKEFIIPKGVSSFPIVLSVDVPKDAPYGRYTGFIRITVEPKEITPGQVGIALGARMEVDLNVQERKIFNFLVKAVEMLESEEGRKFLFFFIPTKLVMKIKIQNNGNVPTAPTQVFIDILDIQKTRILETRKSVKIQGKVLPFQTEDVFAIFKSNLKSGNYWVKFKIFNQKDVIKEGELLLTIRPKGTIPNYKGFNILTALIIGREKEFIFVLIFLLAFTFVSFFSSFFKKKIKKIKK
jgi:hypothetical protein